MLRKKIWAFVAAGVIAIVAGFGSIAWGVVLIQKPKVADAATMTIGANEYMFSTSGNHNYDLMRRFYAFATQEGLSISNSGGNKYSATMQIRSANGGDTLPEVKLFQDLSPGQPMSTQMPNNSYIESNNVTRDNFSKITWRLCYITHLTRGPVLTFRAQEIYRTSYFNKYNCPSDNTAPSNYNIEINSDGTKGANGSVLRQNLVNDFALVATQYPGMLPYVGTPREIFWQNELLWPGISPVSSLDAHNGNFGIVSCQALRGDCLDDKVFVPSATENSGNGAQMWNLRQTSLKTNGICDYAWVRGQVNDWHQPLIRHLEDNAMTYDSFAIQMGVLPAIHISLPKALMDSLDKVDSLNSQLDAANAEITRLTNIETLYTALQSKITAGTAIENVASLNLKNGDTDITTKAQLLTYIEKLKQDTVDMQNAKDTIISARETEISNLNSAHETEISNLNTVHATEISNLNTAHATAIENLETEFAETLAQKLEEHETAFGITHEEALELLNTQHEAAISNLNTVHETEVLNLNTAHETAISGLNAAHATEIQYLETEKEKAEESRDYWKKLYDNFEPIIEYVEVPVEVIIIDEVEVLVVDEEALAIAVANAQAALNTVIWNLNDTINDKQDEIDALKAALEQATKPTNQPSENKGTGIAMITVGVLLLLTAVGEASYLFMAKPRKAPANCVAIPGNRA
jgi:hypothetical protein